MATGAIPTPKNNNPDKNTDNNIDCNNPDFNPDPNNPDPNNPDFNPDSNNHDPNNPDFNPDKLCKLRLFLKTSRESGLLEQALLPPLIIIWHVCFDSLFWTLWLM